MTAPSAASRRVLAILAFLLSACVIVDAAQPPREEVEDPNGKVRKRIVVDDPDTRPPVKPTPTPAPGPAAGSNPELRLDELTRAAEGTKSQALKAFFTRYAVPFDQLAETRGGTGRIRPVPFIWPDGFQGAQAFNVSDLGADNQSRPPRQVEVGGVRKIDHFESLVLADVEKLLKLKPLGTEDAPETLAAHDQFGAAETLLAAALRYHDYARDRNLRRGKGWDGVRRTLIDRLREVRIRQFKYAATADDWTRTREFGTKLLADYPDDATVAREVAGAWTSRAVVLAASSKDADRIEARDMLDRIESRFPGAGGEPARKARDRLRQAAADLAGNGESALGSNNLVQARDYAERAYALDPTAPGVPELRRKLNITPPLYVAVRHFPTRLNPLTARLDSERQAVELVFEGLLEEVPEEVAGRRYRPAAAAAMPGVIPGGRRLPLRLLPRGATGQDGFDSHDVVGTIALYRNRPELWPAAGLPWFTDGLPTPEGGAAVRIAFRNGHPDPRSLLTFKILPAGWLQTQKDGLNETAFVQKPFGTGPFRVSNVLSLGAGKPQELVFVPNDSYARGGRDRKGQPFLKEVRLVEMVKGYDPATEFAAGRLHMLPDALPTEMQKILSPDSALVNRVRVVPSHSSRRVHILAVNHRTASLRNRDLRTGLAHAINRESILAQLAKQTPLPDKVQPRFTAPMVGPFPPGCWATGKAQGITLTNPDDGLNQLRRYLATPAAAAELTLLYPDHDPRAALACSLIKQQVEDLFKTDPAGKKLTVTPQPLPLPTLLVRVMDEHRYDLAYVPFDYPDDWYPYGLAALLDPGAGGRGGRNFLGFRVAGTNPDEEEIRLGQWLEELRGHGDFAGKIAPRTAEIHDKFNAVMPFIPLWQLDRFTVLTDRLRVYVDDTTDPSDPRVLNPTVLFHNAGRWRLE